MSSLSTASVSNPVKSWLSDAWSAPGGARELLILAAPLVVSTISWTLMIFIDRVFLVWYSTEAVGAALPSGVAVYVVICFPLGVAAYTNTFVSQYLGAGRPERVGLAVWQGIFLGLGSSLPALLVIPFAPWFFHSLGHPETIANLEVEYFQALSFGSGAIVIAAAASSYFTGRGRVRIVMIVDSLAAFLNIGLDYLWIFGKGGFPEYGVAGAAWATVVALWFKVIVYLALFLRAHDRAVFGTWRGCRLDRALMARMLRFGAPNGVQYLLEVGAYGAFLLLVGRLGEDALAATTLAFNVNTLAFQPVFGVGIATATLVGRRLGENRPDLAARSTWSAFAVCVAMMGAVGALYLFAPHLLLAPHARDLAEEDFLRLRDDVTVLLRFVAFYCLFDAMNIIFASAIKGAGDTRFVFWTTLAVSGLPVLFTWLGLTYWNQGLLWCWYVITAWVCLLGVIFFWRFLLGKWREMRVIEPA